MKTKEESRYLQLVVSEFTLFNEKHFETVAQLLANKRDNADGVCFNVQSNVEYGKSYQLYVPFYDDDVTHLSVDLIIARTTAAFADMVSQMSQMNRGLMH